LLQVLSNRDNSSIYELLLSPQIIHNSTTLTLANTKKRAYFKEKEPASSVKYQATKEMRHLQQIKLFLKK